jgi:3-isopropylmalate/(R)-2-methylmalate dehydratase large subunit
MTATEKILARASDKCEVKLEEIGWVNVDVLMINDISCPGVSGIFKREFGDTAKVGILQSSP